MASTSSTTKSLSKKNSKKNGNSLAELQDKRLTSRHIAALMKLDDTILENEKLKTRVDILEKETGSCLELHEFARNSKPVLENTKSQYQKQIEELAQTYDAKLLEIQNDLKRLEAENLKLNKEKEELAKENVEYKEQLSNYNTKMEDFKDMEVSLSNLESSTDQMTTEISHYKKQLEDSTQNSKVLKEENEQLKESLQLLQYKNDALYEENDKLRKLLEFEKENEKSSFETTQQGDQEEENDNKEEDLKGTLPEDSEKDKQINELSRKLRLYELERQAIIQSSSDMEIEIQHLKKKLSTLSMSESVTKLKNPGLTPVNSKRPKSSVFRYSQK